MSECARGCVVARRHATDCEDTETCRGCLPRDAEFGLLCYGCHMRLMDMLTTAPGQVALLETVKAATLAHPFKEDHERGGGEDDGAPTPFDLAVHDTIVAIGDVLSAWVEMLCEDYAMAGPERFTVYSGSTWLRAQHARLEACPGIGDLWQELADVMAQAHALAPWREEQTRIKGVPCPECHRTRLVLFGGDEDLTCLTCNARVSPGRYAIWSRDYVRQQRGEEATG